MRLTTEQFERLRSNNPNETQFGTITKVDRYPVIEIKYNLDGEEPLIIARREIATIVQAEGQDPEHTGDEPIGDAALSQIAVSELHTWKAFENELRRVLDDAYDDQHPGQGQGNPNPGPPQAIEVAENPA